MWNNHQPLDYSAPFTSSNSNVCQSSNVNFAAPENLIRPFESPPPRLPLPPARFQLPPPRYPQEQNHHSSIQSVQSASSSHHMQTLSVPPIPPFFQNFENQKSYQKVEFLRNSSSSTTLQDTEKNLTDSEWVQKWSANIKCLTEVNAPLPSSERKDAIYGLKMHLSYEKKRAKRRRVKENKKLNRQLWKETSREKEEKIDEWRRNLMLEEASKLMAEKMKKEADSILTEVRSKQDDVIKLKQLLQSLHKLRTARINKGESHGYVTTSKSDSRFSKLTAHLQEMIDTHTKQYELEEQTLRTMMEESPNVLSQKIIQKGTKDDLEKKKKALHEIYFGDVVESTLSEEMRQFYQSFTAAEDSLEMLHQRRIEWDQFLTEWESPLSSRVPMGYVIPPLSPQGDWSAYQSTNT